MVGTVFENFARLTMVLFHPQAIERLVEYTLPGQK